MNTTAHATKNEQTLNRVILSQLASKSYFNSIHSILSLWTDDENQKNQLIKKQS